MTDFLNTTGKRIRILRQDLGMTQDEMHRRLVANGTEISRSYVSMIEKQDVLAGSHLARGLAKVLNTSSDYLLMLTDDPSPYAEHDENKPQLDEDIRQLIDRLMQFSAPKRQLLLRAVDIIVRLLRTEEEEAAASGRAPTLPAEEEEPEPTLPEAATEPEFDPLDLLAGPYDAAVASYMNQMSPEDQRRAVAKAIELLIQQRAAGSANPPRNPRNQAK